MDNLTRSTAVPCSPRYRLRLLQGRLAIHLIWPDAPPRDVMAIEVLAGPAVRKADLKATRLGQASCLIMRMRCAAILIDATAELVDLGRDYDDASHGMGWPTDLVDADWREGRAASV